ncbi:MAG: glycosyltransferase family 9 protein [Crocinitomicaceae bacterium]|nr:glycosyltransferase family 9 protein [Crocinitomicaceae bacterium]
MNRILIIQTAFLGDVILATPVISELKRLFPKANIDILVKKGNESLLANNPKINSVFTFDKSSGKFKAMRYLIRQFQKSKYDLVINLHRFASSGIIAGRSKATLKYGFKKNPFSFLYTNSFEHSIGDGTHEVERNLSVIKQFGAAKMVRPELYPSSSDFSAISQYQNEDYICLAPASVWKTKQLPLEKWNELVRNNNGKRSYLLGGPGDVELCQSIKENDPVNIINLAGKLSLLQSAALMKDAIHNYVNDSGPLHLASSMNANVTVFFCSTTPDFGFGPLSDNSTIKQVENLDCRPCGLHGHKECPKGHFKCGNEIVI